MHSLFFMPFCSVAFVVTALYAPNYVAAQATGRLQQAPLTESRGVNEWLMRMHQASKESAYIGTFVVSFAAYMSSSKIWHVCKGSEQIERVETLTGPPRSVFRHNDLVFTFMPEHKVVRSEKRETLGLFPDLLKSPNSAIADFYSVRVIGMERVAGVDADVVQLLPKDQLRFGYRVWAEQKSGLVVKLQTLDAEGKVLEQAAFSELQLDAPVNMEKLIQMMGKVDGYRIEKPQTIKTSASAEGWLQKTGVPGFKPLDCYKRPVDSVAVPSVQCIFSDGLASVSVFAEPFDRGRHPKEASFSLGATQTLTRHLDGYWLTVMGEVPIATLRLFADTLERKR